MFTTPITILFSPRRCWQTVAELPESQYFLFIPYLFIASLLPSIAWYYGTVHVGWTIGDGDTVRLTTESAATIAGTFYLAMITCILAIAYAVYWMAETYGSESSYAKGIAVTSLASTPFFLLGLSGFYPVLWVELMLCLVGVAWSTYLLYSGIPLAMNIPKDRGFLFASALVSFIMVIFLILLGATAMLWDNGFLPVFAD